MTLVKSGRSPILRTSPSCFLASNWFFEFEHHMLYIDSVPTARLLGLGSKLYASNKQHLLNKDLADSRHTLTVILECAGKRN